MLADSYIFYEKHHKNKFNKLIHIICIPILVWTVTVMLSSIPLQYEFQFNNLYLKPLKLNTATVVAFLYTCYYFYLDYQIGKSWLYFFGIILYTSNLFILSKQNALEISIYLHILSWILQILSHRFIEGNQPALLTGIIQSFTMAPFFVYLEILFGLGYRKDIIDKIEKIKRNNKIMESYQFKRQ